MAIHKNGFNGYYLITSRKLESFSLLQGQRGSQYAHKKHTIRNKREGVLKNFGPDPSTLCTVSLQDICNHGPPHHPASCSTSSM